MDDAHSEGQATLICSLLHGSLCNGDAKLFALLLCQACMQGELPILMCMGWWQGEPPATQGKAPGLAHTKQLDACLGYNEGAGLPEQEAAEFGGCVCLWQLKAHQHARDSRVWWLCVSLAAKSAPFCPRRAMLVVPIGVV